MQHTIQACIRSPAVLGSSSIPLLLGTKRAPLYRQHLWTTRSVIRKRPLRPVMERSHNHACTKRHRRFLSRCLVNVVVSQSHLKVWKKRYWPTAKSG